MRYLSFTSAFILLKNVAVEPQVIEFLGNYSDIIKVERDKKPKLYTRIETSNE